MKGKKQVLFFLSTLLTISTVFFACKKVDEIPPTITFGSPLANATYSEGDNVSVKALVKDETRLEYVKLFLETADGKQVLKSYNYNLSGATYELNQSYALNDVHLEGGKYYFEIEAFDGNNKQNAYQYIYINAAPVVTKSYFYFTENGSGGTNIYQISPQFSSSFFMTLQGDFSDAAANSYTGQIVSAGKYTGDLRGISVENNNEVWDVPNLGGAVNPYFYKAVYDDDNFTYVSLREGYIRKYDDNGGIALIIPSYQNYYPVNFCMGDSFIVDEECIAGNSDIKLGTYYKISGAVYQTRSIYGLDSIENMFMLNGTEAYCFGNGGGVGKIYKYDLLQNYGAAIKTITGENVLCVCPFLTNTFLIGTANSVLLYNPTMNSILTKFSVGADHIAFDKVNNRILLSKGKNISIYNGQNNANVYNTTAANNVLDLEVLYNK